MRRTIALILLAPGLMNCGRADVGEADAEPGALGGQVAPGGPGYPAGPYGVGEGMVAADAAFWGFARPGEQVSKPQAMRLSDFYNASGAERYPAGSIYQPGAAKPRALVLRWDAEWETVCKMEAKKEGANYPDLHAKGAEYLSFLSERAPGQPATFAGLAQWATVFKVSHPLALDPGYEIGTALGADLYPAYVLIDTRTMTIARTVSGAGTESFWAQVEALASTM